MVSVRDKLKTSAKLETQGINFEIGNQKILLARAGGANTKFIQAMQKVHRENKRAIGLDLMDDAKGRQIVYDAWAEFVVIDWFTNINDEKTDDKGEPLPADWVKGIDGGAGVLLDVTLENVVATFNELPELFTEIKSASEDISYFRAALVEQTVKN